MKLSSLLSLLILSLALGLPTQVAQTASDGWEAVATGIEYQEFQVSDPNNVFVARMDRGNPNVTIESSIAQGRLASGTETVSGMAGRYDQAINYWGQSWGSRNDVVVAINGSFYDPATGIPEGGQIHSGWYSKQFQELGGGSGFAWKLDRTAFIGQCTHHPSTRQFLTVTRTGATQAFQGINRDRGSNELVVFTPQYDTDTRTDSSGVEVLVEMTRPTLILPQPASAKGYVREIRDGQGSTPIPFDHIVLSATGAARTKLLNILGVGDQIGISQEITHFEDDCATPYPFDWTKTYASVSGSFDFLLDGVIYSFDDPGATARHPRTAICFNATYIYFLVVDGRDPARSVGMTIGELASFCQDTLGAAWGINQDGGGSSTIVVNGVVKNNPSDGSERAVGNGLMMVVVEPMEQSAAFAADDPIVTISSTEMRLGPGTNYSSLTTISERTDGVVLDHFNNLEGALATGSYWWKVALGGTVGWVAEEALVSDVPTGFIVESRAGGLNDGNYADSGLVDSDLKSNAPGTTAGIGSREGKLKGTGPTRWASFSFIPTTTGLYEVHATWAPSGNNGAQVEHVVTHDGGSNSVLVDQTFGENTWNSLGQYDLMAGNTYTVRISNESFPAPKKSAEVFRADAVLWELISGDLPPSVSIINPADSSTVAGLVTIQVQASDAEDPVGSLTVEVAIDAGLWQTASYNAVSGYYELFWDTTVGPDGSHTIDAQATDGGGNLAGAATVNVTVDNFKAATLHVGDLDATSTSVKREWTASVTIMVHDAGHNPLTNASVTGTWSGGFSGVAACVTGSSGQCSLGTGNILKKQGSVTFTVDGVSHASLTYQQPDNHDPDGDSDGTIITVSKQ